jgi:hypothetical protein
VTRFEPPSIVPEGHVCVLEAASLKPPSGASESDGPALETATPPQPVTESDAATARHRFIESQGSPYPAPTPSPRASRRGQGSQQDNVHTRVPLIPMPSLQAQ